LTPAQVLRTPLSLPVMLGEELAIDEEYPWEDFPTVGDGEHSSPAPGNARPQARFTGETMSLTWSPRWLATPDISPEHVRRELLRIGRKRAIFDLLIVNKPSSEFAEFSGYANIRRISRAIKRGEADTRYYTIDFAEYRSMDVGRRKHRFGAQHPSTHALDANDTLRSLARELLGNEGYWRNIAEANGLTKWGSNDPIVDSKRYSVGDRIKIPDTESGGGTAFPGRDQVGAIAQNEPAN
jgi:nucleoid-associated protein YgaU